MAREYDVAVIGAGHNGLVAAFYLARAGLSVVVLEQQPVVGGLCVTRELFAGVRGNYVANTPNNLEPKVIADMELTSHGLRWADALEPNSMMIYPEGRRIVSWPDESDEAAEFDRYAPGEYERYRTMLDDLERLGASLDVTFFGPPPRFEELAARLRTASERDLFAAVMYGSASDLVARYLDSDEARTSIGILATTGNYVGPDTPGSALQLMMRAMYRGSREVREGAKIKATADFSPRAPIGGMGAITQAMAASATARGATVRVNCRVAQILCAGGAVSGVVLESGEEIPARAVVSNVNPRTTVSVLVPDGVIDPEVRRGWDELEMDGVIGKVHVLMDGTPRFDCAASEAENAVLMRCGFRAAPSLHAMQTAYEHAARGSWRGDPIVYGLVQSAFDDTLAPPGMHVMSLSVLYAPYDLADGDWSSEGKPWAEHVVRSMGQYIGNLDSILVDCACVTPRDLEDQFGLFRGHPLHGDAVLSHMFDCRPVAGYGDYRTPVPGLYLCSNGTWPGNYLSGLCGHNAAGVLLRDTARSAEVVA